MSIWSSAFAPKASGPSAGTYIDPLSGFMIESSTLNSGVVVTDRAISQCMVVLGALRWLSNAVAVCSTGLQVLESRDDQRRVEVSKKHYLRRLLKQPNKSQSRFRFFRNNTYRAARFGNSYSEIVAGPLPTAPFQTFAAELRPLDTRSTRVIDQRENGELIYETIRTPYNKVGGKREVLGQERVFHLRGAVETEDGNSGENIQLLIRNAVAIALAAEKHTATFLKKGARLAGLLVPAGPMGKKERDDLRASLVTDMGGVENTGTLGMIPFGMDLKQLASNNRDSQLQELREFEIRDILMGLGTPGIVVGYSDKAFGYGSAKEFYESGGLRHCVLPWLENFESEIETSLVLDDEEIDVELDMEVFTRPDIWQRCENVVKLTGRPVLDGNEGRLMLNYNPKDDDPSMDKVAGPTGQEKAAAEGSKGGRPKDPKKPKRDPVPSDEEARSDSPAIAKARQVAQGAATFLVDREMTDILTKAPKYARNWEGWKTWVAGYYDKHAERLVSVLAITPEKAKRYCADNAAAILAGGVTVMTPWSSTMPPVLVALTLEEVENAAA